MAKRRIHIYFSGRVQGVGFRFTAERLARNLKIAGWAKNLFDGQVEVVAEAEENTLNDFLQQMKDNFHNYIEDIEIDWKDNCEGLVDFQIRF
ncbi:MAG: acylphosphatase [Candidatus Omnitrophica bacterium]|nr:acylphosphatase [Candidatus Omnitrophota bacterium]